MLYATIGPRMVMAGAGGINHEELCDLTTKHFGKIGHTYDAEIPLDLNCRYTGMLIIVSYSINTYKESVLTQNNPISQFICCTRL